MSPKMRIRRTLALVLAGGSLALGVPAALAAGGDAGGSDAGGAAAPNSGFVQDEQNRPDHDCPERGDGGGSSGDGGGSSADATPTPEV